nr:iron-containing alcohol dehydrogenase [Desulfobacterales bacterium]
MLNFDFFMPTHLVFGPGRLDELEHTFHLPAGKRAMVVIGADGAMLKEGYLARVQGLLAARGVATLVCDRIRPNPESAQIDEAAARAREKEAAFIVGLGGGSTIDAAKSIALMARNPGLYWDYVTGGSGGG